MGNMMNLHRILVKKREGKTRPGRRWEFFVKSIWKKLCWQGMNGI